MQAHHHHAADHADATEFGARVHLLNITGVNANTQVAGAPQVTAAQEGSELHLQRNLDANGGKATDTDAAVGAAILTNIRTKQDAAQGSRDLGTVIDGFGADGTFSTMELPALQALGLGGDSTAAQLQAVKEAAKAEAGTDQLNFSGSQETDDPEIAKLGFQELYDHMYGGDADASQRATTELTRRYAAGVEWRGDIDVQIQIAHREFQLAADAQDNDTAVAARNEIARLQQQQQQLDGSLANIRTAIKGSVEHGGALNGVRLNELRGADNTIDSSAEARYAAQHGGADGAALPQGLVVTEDGKLAAVVPEGGSIWKTVEQFPKDGKFDTELYDELVRNYGEGVNPGDQLVLSQAATDRIRQNITLSQSGDSAAEVGGPSVAAQQQLASNSTGIHDDARLNQAVQHIVDAEGDVSFDGTQFNENGGGRVTGHVRELLTKYIAETGSAQQGIDKLVGATQFDEHRAGNDVAKQIFQRELYAAYGVQAAAPGASGDGVTQAVTDFVQLAGDQEFDSDGAGTAQHGAKIEDSQIASIVAAIKSAPQFAGNQTITRETIEQFVGEHFFTREGSGDTKTVSSAESVQRRQLVDALAAAYANA